MDGKSRMDLYQREAKQTSVIRQNFPASTQTTPSFAPPIDGLGATAAACHVLPLLGWRPSREGKQMVQKEKKYIGERA